MSASLENSRVSRFILAPAMLAVLIAGPLASILAGQFGMSWWTVFLLAAGGLAVFWDLAILREPNGAKPLAEKQDPVFGHLHCFEEGLWQVDDRVQMEGSWLPVSIEAGQEGPSGEQQEAYRDFLKHPGQYREELVKTLVRDTDETSFPGLRPIRLFLPQVQDTEACSLEIEVHVDGDQIGPHSEVVGFQDGHAVQARHLANPGSETPDSEIQVA